MGGPVVRSDFWRYWNTAEDVAEATVVTEIERDLKIVSVRNITSVDSEFNRLERIRGYLFFNDVSPLMSISGFTSLQSVDVLFFAIRNNDFLESISGFGQLQTVSGQFELRENSALTPQIHRRIIHGVQPGKRRTRR